MRLKLLTLVTLFAFTACGADPQPGDELSDMVAPGIATGTLMAGIERLASDEFEGRSPGSAGEALTVQYLIDQFRELELAPGNPDGTWVQDVPLVGITPLAGDVFTVNAGGAQHLLEPGIA